MNKPTNGRIVHYFPRRDQIDFDRTQPKAAIIVHVHSPECVNLSVFTQSGHSLAHSSVKLLPDGSFVTQAEKDVGGFAMWPERDAYVEQLKSGGPAQQDLANMIEQAESGKG